LLEWRRGVGRARERGDRWNGRDLVAGVVSSVPGIVHWAERW
jgi:hypothetical protein